MPPDEAAISAALSAPRAATYIAASGGDRQHGLELYGWNARVSAALMVPAHFAEVTTRNAVSDALTSLYGPQWPWNPTFHQSLPTPTKGFNPRRHLAQTVANLQGNHGSTTTGKVIAELKFVFWQGMFTARHDVRVWTPHILTLFPNAAGQMPKGLRFRINNDLETIRQLRNRIAHHEPIFNRQLNSDLSRMIDLVHLRSEPTAAWVRAMEEVTIILAERPQP